MNLHQKIEDHQIKYNKVFLTGQVQDIFLWHVRRDYNSMFDSGVEDNKKWATTWFFYIIKLMPSSTFCFIHSVFIPSYIDSL